MWTSVVAVVPTMVLVVWRSTSSPRPCEDHEVPDVLMDYCFLVKASSPASLTVLPTLSFHPYLMIFLEVRLNAFVGGGGL